MVFPVKEASHSWEKRMDVVATYMLLGNLRVVSEKHDIPYSTLIDWKKSDWWPEMVEQIRRQKKSKTASSITDLVENSLDVLKDRLENGDWVLNQKTGEMVRKAVPAKDALAIANHLIQRQLQIEEVVEKTQQTQDTVQETLVLLAKEFQKWNRNEKTKEAIDVDFKEISHEEK